MRPMLYTSIQVTSTETFYKFHVSLMKADRSLRALVQHITLNDIDSRWDSAYWDDEVVRYVRGFLLNVMDACPNLCKLCIRGSDISTGPSFFRDSFQLHPGHRHITHLNIVNCGHIKSTPSLVRSICEWPALGVLELPNFTGEPRWRQLFHTDRHAVPSSEEIAAVLPSSISPIKSLFFQSRHGLDNISLCSMLFMPKNLQHLSLCAAFWPEGLEHAFATIGHGLVSLRVNTARHVVHLFDDNITKALAYCTSLISLQLDNSLYQDYYVDVLPPTLANLTINWIEPSKCSLASLEPLLVQPTFRRLEAQNGATPFKSEDVEHLQDMCGEHGVTTKGALFDPKVNTLLDLMHTGVWERPMSTNFPHFEEEYQ